MPCLAFLSYNFGQLIHSKHLTDLVDNSKQQQSVKNSDDDWSIGQVTCNIFKKQIKSIFL